MPAIMPALAETRITIVGLGLMGGSLALALRGKCATLTAVDINPDTRALAMRRGVVERVTGDLQQGLDGCDLLVLATPVRVILRLLHTLSELAAPAQPLRLLDLGSTKGEITDAMRSLPAHIDPLGGHPMCGKETMGLAHADGELFRDETFMLTPLARTGRGMLALGQALVAAVGAQPLLIEPERHDRLVAMSSHLPYLLASSLMQAAQGLAAEDEQLWSVAASGFRDATRLAASDVTMMGDILRTNQTYVREAIRRQRAALDRFEALLVDDPQALETLLAELRALRLSLYPPAGPD